MLLPFRIVFAPLRRVFPSTVIEVPNTSLAFAVLPIWTPQDVPVTTQDGSVEGHGSYGLPNVRSGSSWAPLWFLNVGALCQTSPTPLLPQVTNRHGVGGSNSHHFTFMLWRSISAVATAMASHHSHCAADWACGTPVRSRTLSNQTTTSCYVTTADSLSSIRADVADTQASGSSFSETVRQHTQPRASSGGGAPPRT